jgi:hypothetical protein
MDMPSARSLSYSVRNAHELRCPLSITSASWSVLGAGTFSGHLVFGLYQCIYPPFPDHIPTASVHYVQPRRVGGVVSELSRPPHLVDNHAPAQDRLRCGWTEAGGEAQVDSGALVESLQDQVMYLKEQLDIRTEELREHRRLLAGLIERVPELEAPADTPAFTQSREEAAQEPAESAVRSRGRRMGETARPRAL